MVNTLLLRNSEEVKKFHFVWGELHRCDPVRERLPKAAVGSGDKMQRPTCEAYKRTFYVLITDSDLQRMAKGTGQCSVLAVG